ncbi:MAG: helix-turn-helix domain-containing protein [Deltaproteobacteria bacterium]|nr:helix-turn-helix domain-containing protein [Deltaproteobacteria bacterium]
MNHGEPLASQLREALARAGATVDEISDQTKVPRSTLRVLLGEPISAMLPARVYLRGHLKLVARQLKVEDDVAMRLFDEAYPSTHEERDVVELPRVRGSTMAIAAAIAGVGVLAVILSIFG